VESNSRKLVISRVSFVELDRIEGQTESVAEGVGSMEWGLGHGPMYYIGN
jgi:hypothetical protein